MLFLTKLCLGAALYRSAIMMGVRPAIVRPSTESNIVVLMMVMWGEEWGRGKEGRGVEEWCFTNHWKGQIDFSVGIYCFACVRVCVCVCVCVSICYFPGSVPSLASQLAVPVGPVGPPPSRFPSITFLGDLINLSRSRFYKWPWISEVIERTS